MKINITFLIPFLLIISTTIASIAVYIKHDQQANKTIRKDALSRMKLDITRLQNILYNLLTERANNIEEARLNLSVTAMDQSIKSLLLIDDGHKIIMSNRYFWEGKQANNISGYEADTAKKVIDQNTPKAFFHGKDNALLTGYYPVVLQLESNDLPIKRMGTLYTEISIANKLAYAKNEAAVLSISLAIVMLIVTALLALLLHFMFSLRLSKLTKAVDKFAWGDLDASLSIGGNDELTVVGNAFNEMAKQIRKDIWLHEEAEYNLLQLNKTLEQRVQERTQELELKKQELLDSQALAHHANKMTSLGEMASGIAHEINSPLQVISILTYKARKSFKQSEP
ncbi:MAG: HAMP domain-containing protein, partial [Gammaproteobacteria bacterium]|nr:HAMP domain-containing protein [Gammaproteobacteria bacterium]